MSEEEIKKLAKRFELDMYPTMPDMLSVKAMLEWLCKNFCIVPKEKVTELYECGFTSLSGQQTKSILKYLFGKEVFHTKGKRQ